MAQLGTIKVSPYDVGGRGGVLLRVKVQGLRSFGLRAKVLTAIFRVAGWVSPVPIDIDLACSDVHHEDREPERAGDSGNAIRT